MFWNIFILGLEEEDKLKRKCTKGLLTHALFIIFMTYISTDNFLSPIALSDWLVFCYRNLMQKNNKNNNNNNNK